MFVSRCRGVPNPACMSANLISQQSLAKLQMVSFQDGGAVKLRQRITRPGDTHTQHDGRLYCDKSCMLNLRVGLAWRVLS